MESANLKLMIEYILRDADRHEQSNFSELGKEFELVRLEQGLPPEAYIAWNFWDSWIDEKNHDFPEFYDGIKKEDWSKLAREIVNNISNRENIKNKLVGKYFDRRSR